MSGGITTCQKCSWAPEAAADCVVVLQQESWAQRACICADTISMTQKTSAPHRSTDFLDWLFSDGTKEEHMVCIHFDQRDWGSLYSLQTSTKSWSSLRAGKMESKYTCYWPQHSASDPAPISLTYLSSLHRRAERPLTRRSQSTNSVRSYFLQELHPNIQQDTSEKKKHHRREDILLNKYASEGFPTTAEPQ